MALVIKPFEEQIKYALSGGAVEYAKLSGESKNSIDKVAKELSIAIDAYIRSATVTTVVTTAVTTSGTQYTQTGIGTGAGTGTLS